mmetsp:Transcript_33084/g.87836  ORF Transcript_33084/g.87836 Transcript_33084/m.87836 type:complete len:407 (+) Transcript_33084:230-1450(+)
MDPLRCYLHKEGLARFCTQRYTAPTSKNLSEAYMHLTNYSLNKNNAEGFVHDDEESGSKRSLRTAWEQISTAGHDADSAWEAIQEMCRRVMLAKQAFLWYSYHTLIPVDDGASACFQILGFDVLLDERMRPWLLETNNGPSLNLDQDIDRSVKLPVVSEALEMVKPFYSQPAVTPTSGNSSSRPSAATTGPGSCAIPGPVTEADILALRARRQAAHTKALAWELKSAEGFELLYDGEELQGELQVLFPLARPEVMEAFEIASRVGERPPPSPSGAWWAGPMRGLTQPKFAGALRQLGLLDGKIVSRTDADLAYKEAMKDQDRDKGMTYEIFGRALIALAVRLIPPMSEDSGEGGGGGGGSGSSRAVDSLAQLLDDGLEACSGTSLRFRKPAPVAGGAPPRPVSALQ